MVKKLNNVVRRKGAFLHRQVAGAAAIFSGCGVSSVRKGVCRVFCEEGNELLSDGRDARLIYMPLYGI